MHSAPPLWLALAMATVSHANVNAQPAERGRLLYETHCAECHSTQMHWREKRLAHDWDSLRDQVVRWQNAARLSWSDADIDEVTRHLNDTIYRFPRAQAQALRTAPAAGR